MAHFDNTPLDSDRLLDRRGFLGQMGTGLGSIALACLLMEEAGASDSPRPGYASREGVGGGAPHSPLLAKEGVGGGAARPPHYSPRAKRVIQIFCPGAVSQIDTFEYKPELQKRHDQP